MQRDEIDAMNGVTGEYLALNIIQLYFEACEKKNGCPLYYFCHHTEYPDEEECNTDRCVWDNFEEYRVPKFIYVWNV